MTTRNDITGDPIKTKGRLSEEGRDNWDRIFGHKKEAEVSDDLILSVEDRTQYEKNWDKMLDREPADEVSYDPAANVGMLMTDYGASETLATEIQEHVRLDDVERKLKEWDMMYECLKSMHLYEYPVEEAKEVLKRIEDEK